MKQFFLTLLRNALGCFKRPMLCWHGVAIVISVLLVTSGLDWFYFSATRARELRSWAWPAVRVGAELPILLPLALLVLGLAFRKRAWNLCGAAIAQAVILGSLISSAYKAFTGRVHPMREMGADISRDFRFGFWRGGVFWGWPSSHTTIAFAMAVTIYILRPRQRWLGWIAVGYALYVGLGVSVTIHWFSDFSAGAIIGSVIGVVVGRSFCGLMIQPEQGRETKI